MKEKNLYFNYILRKFSHIFTFILIIGFFILGGKNMFGADFRYFTQQKGAYASSTPYGNNLSVGHYAQTPDAKIYYEIYGQGKPLFVLHGGGVGTPFEMGQLIDTLRENYQVIVVSTRGHGKSEIGNTPITYEQKAEDMIAVMNEVTKEKAVLLGFSDGAYTAYKVASMFPDRVERIVAIGAGTLEPGYFQGDMRLEDLEKIDPEFIAQQKSLMPEPERWQEFCTKYMSFWSTMKIDREFLQTVQCPVLLIAGDEDDHAPMVTMVKAMQYLPNSRLCIVPKAWHTAFIDNFPVTWNAIEPFLSAENPAGSTKVPYND